MSTLTNPFEIARETLKQLATRRVAPTPDNYLTLYNEIAGIKGGTADELGLELSEVEFGQALLIEQSYDDQATSARTWARQPRRSGW